MGRCEETGRMEVDWVRREVLGRFRQLEDDRDVGGTWEALGGCGQFGGDAGMREARADRG